jgi:hypothetical protein
VLNLNDSNVSYFIISSKQIDATKTLLWAKEWEIIPLKGYYDGVLEDSILAFKMNIDNKELKEEAIFMLKTFDEDSCIIKYTSKKNPNKLFRNGKETELSEAFFNQESINKSYLYNGVFFSFNEVKSYKLIELKQDLKNGMIVEYFNNQKWCSASIFDIEVEWDNFYKLLSKYKKVRVLT